MIFAWDEPIRPIERVKVYISAEKFVFLGWSPMEGPRAGLWAWMVSGVVQLRRSNVESGRSCEKIRILSCLQYREMQGIWVLSERGTRAKVYAMLADLTIDLRVKGVGELESDVGFWMSSFLRAVWAKNRLFHCESKGSVRESEEMVDSNSF